MNTVTMLFNNANILKFLWKDLWNVEENFCSVCKLNFLFHFRCHSVFASSFMNQVFFFLISHFKEIIQKQKN